MKRYGAVTLSILVNFCQWTVLSVAPAADQNSCYSYSGSTTYYMSIRDNITNAEGAVEHAMTFLKYYNPAAVSMEAVITNSVYRPASNSVTFIGSGWMNRETNNVIMQADIEIRSDGNAWFFFRAYENLGGSRGTLLYQQPNWAKTFFTDLQFVDVTSRGTPYTWLSQFGVTNNFDVGENTDLTGKGMKLWQEYLAGTNPRDAASRFEMSDFRSQIGGGVQVTWTSYTNWIDTPFGVERCTNMTSGAWQLVGPNVRRTPPVNTWSDTNPPPGAVCFYRIVATNGI